MTMSTLSSPSDSPSITLHGVFMDVMGTGVLLSGQSGIGKSELALGLINHGHRLIADDSVIIEKSQKDDKLIGRCPAVLQDFLEVRGLGILNIRAMFGDTAIKENKALQLIVNIIQVQEHELHQIDRLHGLNTQHDILGTLIPGVSIPVAPGRNLAVLVEGAVRNHMLRLTGYQASKEFTARQQSYIQSQTQEKM